MTVAVEPDPPRAAPPRRARAGAAAEWGWSRIRWLAAELTPDRVRELLPEAAELEVEVHPLPRIAAVNVIVHRLLGEGVASSTRLDPQAKAVGEWLRARVVTVPTTLIPEVSA